MKQKGTLWIDLTMLINWSGHLTGIQRVEYNLAKRYSQHDNVKFFVFHKKQLQFTQFDFIHIDNRIKELQTVPGEATEEVVSTNFVDTLLGKARSIAKPIFPPATKAFLRKQYDQLRTLRHRIGYVGTPAVFGPDDTLLILSGDWSDGTFASLVSGLRAKHHFKVIQVVYDMLPAYFPAYFVPGMPKQFSSYMKRIFSVADGILAISESSKRDVLAFMKNNNIPHVPVGVFRLGDDFVQKKPTRPDMSVKKDKYILYVSTIEARKNHMLLYYAAREALTRGEDFPSVVLVGRRGWLAEDFLYQVENDPVLSKKFLFTNCTDQELAWLYQNCNFTVFPSFYEGWGLMVSESLFYGKFCLSSNTSSMPEIAGELVDYFSPNDPITLLEKILVYSRDAKLLRNKEAAIKAKYKATSWDETLEQVQRFVSKISS